MLRPERRDGGRNYEFPWHSTCRMSANTSRRILLFVYASKEEPEIASLTNATPEPARNSGVLLRHHLLRTECATFTVHGSSTAKGRTGAIHGQKFYTAIFINSTLKILLQELRTTNFASVYSLAELTPCCIRKASTVTA